MSVNSKEHKVIIHVNDASRLTKKDFICSKDLIVQNMKYFIPYVNSDSDEEIEISINCDLTVFELLVTFMKDPPKLNIDTQNVVSILISSYFLQMNSLVLLCIDYIVYHFTDVANLPIDFSCISEKILKILCDKLELCDIDVPVKRMDLINRLINTKLSLLLDHLSLTNCVYCGQLFDDRLTLLCHNNKNINNTIIRNHSPSRNINLKKYIQELRDRRIPPLQIYFNLWVSSTTVPCMNCGYIFLLSEFNCCLCHPNHLNSEDNTYTCCNYKIDYNPQLLISIGCSFKIHNNPDYQRMLEYVAKNESYILPVRKKTSYKPVTITVPKERKPAPIMTVESEDSGDDNIDRELQTNIETRTNSRSSNNKNKGLNSHTIHYNSYSSLNIDNNPNNNTYFNNNSHNNNIITNPTSFNSVNSSVAPDKTINNSINYLEAFNRNISLFSTNMNPFDQSGKSKFFKSDYLLEIDNNKMNLLKSHLKSLRRSEKDAQTNI